MRSSQKAVSKVKKKDENATTESKATEQQANIHQREDAHWQER